MTWNHVAFGTGEPNLKPFLSEAKGMGRNAFMMALSNVALALAMNCFFPKWAVTPDVSAYVGLTSAASYSLIGHAIEHFLGGEKLEAYQEKALLGASLAGSSLIFLGKATAAPLLSLAVLDIGILEVSLCFYQ